MCCIFVPKRQSMHHYYLILSFLLITISAAFAQENKQYSLQGTVIGDEDMPLPYAAMALYKQQDSSLLQSTTTDEKGVFEVQVRSGLYYVQVQFLSYQPLTIDSIQVEDKNINLGKINLAEDKTTLEEVVVSTERKEMEIRLDKRVFNVDKDPQNKGRNAQDILDNLPSVTVDMDGNVSLRGSQNVRILIDGKPSGLVGIRSLDALRQLQGNMIERIEVITNPSARYDAEGEVGIINIVLKKEKRKGVNGSFDVRAGYPEDFGGGFSINYRSGMVNLFASYGAGYQKRPGFGSSYQIFENADTAFSYDRYREHKRGGFSNQARIGSNIYFKSNHTLTISGLYSYSHGNNDATLTYTDYDENGTQTQEVIRKDDETEIEQTIEASLNYKKEFKRKGQVFTFDFQFTDNKDGENSSIEETSNLSSIAPILQKVSNTENEQRWLIQTDYVHPWGKDGKIETGAKAMLRNINNDFTVQEQNSTGEWLTLNNFNDQFLYTENIYAVYAMAGNKWGNFSAQAGLRFEYSDVKTELVESKTVNHRQYYNFFPSTHFSYEFKKQHTLQISYSRRINRPRFWWLLPFFGYSDSRNIFGGNPNLNPEFVNSIELGHIKYWDKGSLLSSIYYRHTDNKMDRLLLSDTAGITQRFPVNVGFEHSFGVELSGSYTPWDWWDLSANVNFYRSIVKGEYQGIRYDNDTYAWNAQAKTKWTIKKIFHIQISLNYRSPMLDAQGFIKARYNIDAGLSLDVLKGKGTITFNARDIFNTRKRQSEIYGEDFYSESEFQWRSRRFLVNFSYRLNQKKSKGKGGRGKY